MEQVEIFNFYAFGHDYRLLLDMNETVTNRTVHERLIGYFEFLASLNLNVTLAGIRQKKLSEDFEELEEICKDDKKLDEKIQEDLYLRIVDKLRKIDNILDAELTTKVGYIPSEKKFPIETLQSNIDKLFGENVFTKILDLAQYDFKECGQCLVFDRYTASAFHCLRATEDVLKQYYSLLLSAIPKDNETWWDFTDAIERQTKTKAITPEPPEELMHNLNNLRKYYRNKTQHPNKIYNKDEAQDLLNMCTKTTNEIIWDLIKRSKV